MGTVRIVTDSSANFEDPCFAERHGITIVPLTIQIGEQTYLDGVDITAEEVLQRMRHISPYPAVSAPPITVFEEIYQRLGRQTDQICVLVHSQHFTETFTHAQEARASLLGRCQIAVIDSQTTSLGLGYLVEAVAGVAEAGASLDEVVRVARSVIPRLYSVYYVDTLDYIERGGLLARTQTILGTMLSIKPLLTIEDGQLITMEKARTHSQAIDKMLEFVMEFTRIERLGILQSTLRTTDRTRMLQDRLALELAWQQYPITLYEPLIASMIGPDAMGIAVLESASSRPEML